MRLFKQTLAFSATDLVNFLGCRHATYLDVLDLADPVASTPDDPFLALLQAKGLAHERAYLEGLRSQGREVADLAAAGSGGDRFGRTREAMRAGVEVIYQGALQGARWRGYADFLTRVPGASLLGNFHYEAVDTKLSSVAKPKHALQLAVYSRLLAAEQGVSPKAMHIVVGDGSIVSVRTADLHYYSEVAREGLEAFADALPSSSRGEPCSHCANCRWSSRCEEEWQRTDHLSLVAGITRGQRAKLEEAGISTMAALASSPAGGHIGGMNSEILKRIRAQAGLQVAKRADGENRVEVLDLLPGKGFARLPRPDNGDLFFDMEGDPLFAGGLLEYLFGFVNVVNGKSRFTAFWGHDRAEEKIAFERAMDFITAQLERFPGAHIYHYASYEESAIKRLAMLHGTRADAVDHLLRTGKLVDLYQVVRESIRVSEPGYSIKNLEVFYMEARSGDVKDAGASVVVYEQWRQLKNPKLLKDISDYNEFDCISTWKLCDWLLKLRPAAVEWRNDLDEEPDEEREETRRDAEQRCVDTQAALMRAPESEQSFRDLVRHFLEFHRREAKPVWWAMFNRQKLSEEELIDDAECIGGLQPDSASPPYAEKRSLVHSFLFPPQDFKFRVGRRAKRADTLKDAGEIVFLDDTAGQIALKISALAEAYGSSLSLIPNGPIETEVMRDAIYRYADSVIDGGGDYPAIRSILQRELPRIRDVPLGQAIIPQGAEVVQGASSAIARLEDSYLLVQGPPGTGKTYLSAHAIVDLLTQGQRIGVSSNSHKAINNLLVEVERQALDRQVLFRGAKRSPTEDHHLNGAIIVDVEKNEEISEGDYDLIAGTAWMFARPEFDQTLDYLFIDEAGQVSIANVVAMGLSARNIVLVGDQMQLAQPAQGVHPGDSGKSALDFLLGDTPTVPPERGIFLPVTRRMHPDVCRFISEAVYEGRLQPEPPNANQRLVLASGADGALKPTGIAWVPVIHEGCSQKSEEEAVRIAELYASLLSQRWVNRQGIDKPIGHHDILVVSPYNMQVNHLKSVLPAGARVGTVDKFQGQEAAVVMVSMTTSTAEDISRGMDFLYSRNRLNVAISRAKCLAMVVASPKLLEASCNTIDQLKLVNMTCFVRAYAVDSSGFTAL